MSDGRDPTLSTTPNKPYTHTLAHSAFNDFRDGLIKKNIKRKNLPSELSYAFVHWALHITDFSSELRGQKSLLIKKKM